MPYLIWRPGRTDDFAPLVVVQVLTSILLGPGTLGAALPACDEFAFTPAITGILDGLGGWAMMLLVFIAGIELHLGQAWLKRGLLLMAVASTMLTIPVVMPKLAQLAAASRLQAQHPATESASTFSTARETLFLGVVLEDRQWG